MFLLILSLLPHTESFAMITKIRDIYNNVQNFSKYRKITSLLLLLNY